MIRPATPDDAAALSALSIEVWINTYVKTGVTTEFAHYVLAEFSLSNMQSMLSSGDQMIWVSHTGDGIDGYIRVSNGVSAPVEACGSNEIATLYVQPRHQGQGIGGGLLKCAIEGFGQDLWLMVNCENLKAVAFYEAHGFQAKGITHFELGDAAYANHVMTLVSPS